MASDDKNNKAKDKGKDKGKVTKNKSKKSDTAVLKIVGIIVGVIIVLFMVSMVFLSFKNKKKKNIKPEDLVVGQQQAQQQVQQQPTKGTEEKIPDSNAVDVTKTQQVAGTTQGANDTNKQYTTDDLKKMTKEERKKALENTVDNRQAEQPQGFMTEDELKNSKIKLPFNPEEVAVKQDYANYSKKSTKLDDRTFILWLDAKYNGKKYYMVCDPTYWNNLQDVGITPVEVKFFIDSNGRENVISVMPLDNSQ